jgi:hypothetical protein
MGWMGTGHGGSPRSSNMVKKESERTWPQFDALLDNIGNLTEAFFDDS